MAVACFLLAAVSVAVTVPVLASANRTMTAHVLRGARLLQVSPVMVNAAELVSVTASRPVADRPELASVNVCEAVCPAAKYLQVRVAYLTGRSRRAYHGAHPKEAEMSRLLMVVLVVIGIVAVVVGIIYLVEPVHSLPSFFPGYAAHKNLHHHDRGYAAIGVGVILLIVAALVGRSRRHAY